MNKNIINTKRNYSEYCPNGFILCPDELGLDWKKITFSNLNFYYSSNTTIYLSSALNVLVVGNVFDLESQLSGDCVVEKIKSSLEFGLEACLKYVSYLAGRFLVIVVYENEIFVIPDSHCTLACYWSEEKRNVFASHLQLMQDYFNCEKNILLSEIMNHKDYISPGGKYFPAKLTPLNNVYPLIANCFLRSEIGGRTYHERFYPKVSLKKKYENYDKGKIYYYFKQYLQTFLRLSYKPSCTYISLTNGLDSRAVLAALLLAGIRLESFTYTKFGGNYTNYEKDLVGASKLAATASFPHFILVLPELNYDSKFFKFYKKTFSLHARFPTLAQAYYEQLPINANVLISTISETGTVFYKVRDQENISAKVLAQKWTNSKINSLDIIEKVFNDYIEYTEFTNQKILDFDLYDLFYWEHRNSKWANLWYQECDLSHNVILPFNCRLINELMLAMPYEDRVSRYLLNELIKEAGLQSDSEAYL